MVSISGGVFFITAAIFFIFKAFYGERKNYLFLAFASIFLGLSVGSRANMLFAVVIILFISLIYFVVKYKKNGLKKILLSAIYLIFPLLVILVSLGIYNYLRFDNFWEFGFKYQPGNYNYLNYFEVIKKYGLYKISVLLYSPPIFRSTFPYIFLRNFLTFEPKFFNMKLDGFIGEYSSLIYISPFVFIFFVALLLLIFESIKHQNLKFLFEDLKLKIILLLLIFIIFVLIVSQFIVHVMCMRYSADFATFALILAVLSWFYIEKYSLVFRKNRIYLTFIFVCLSIITIYFGLATGVNGFYAIGGNLRQANPDLFNYLNHLFK